MLEKKNYQYLKTLPANFQDSLVVRKDRWQRGKLIRTGCVSIHKMVGVKKSKPKKIMGAVNIHTSLNNYFQNLSYFYKLNILVWP